MALAFDFDPVRPHALDRLLAPQGIESDEPPMENDQHLRQMLLLLSSLDWWWRDRTDYYAAGNLTVYYSPRQLKSEHFRGPDFFVVLGTTKKSRKSWVVWDEGGMYPNLIVELLSEGTAAMDRGLKKQIYQDVFRTPEYFLYDPATAELDGQQLIDGRYESIAPDADGRLPSAQLGLSFGVREGRLRLFTGAGEMLPDMRELGLKAEAAEHRAEAASSRAERLAAALRAMGVDPDSLK